MALNFGPVIFHTIGSFGKSRCTPMGCYFTKPPRPISGPQMAPSRAGSCQKGVVLAISKFQKDRSTLWRYRRIKNSFLVGTKCENRHAFGVSIQEPLLGFSATLRLMKHRHPGPKPKGSHSQRITVGLLMPAAIIRSKFGICSPKRKLPL